MISYAADNALALSAGTVPGAAILTSEFKINYLRPAVGTQLIARATALCSSRTQAVRRCEGFAGGEGKEDLCGAAQGTLVRTGRPAEEQA